MALPRRTAANDYESRSPGVSHKDTTGASTIKSLLLGLLLGFDTSQSIGRTAFSEIYDFLAAQTDESCYADSNEMQA